MTTTETLARQIGAISHQHDRTLVLPYRCSIVRLAAELTRWGMQAHVRENTISCGAPGMDDNWQLTVAPAQITVRSISRSGPSTATLVAAAILASSATT